MKKHVFYLIVTLLLMGCQGVTPNDYGFIDDSYFEENYQITNPATTIKIINFDEFKKIKESSPDYIIALSRPTCEYCQTTIPRLIRALDENNISELFFLNTDKLTSSEKSALVSEYHVEGVPTIYFKSGSGSESMIVGEGTEDELRENIIKLKGDAE